MTGFVGSRVKRSRLQMQLAFAEAVPVKSHIVNRLYCSDVAAHGARWGALCGLPFTDAPKDVAGDMNSTPGDDQWQAEAG